MCIRDSAFSAHSVPQQAPPCARRPLRAHPPPCARRLASPSGLRGWSDSPLGFLRALCGRTSKRIEIVRKRPPPKPHRDGADRLARTLPESGGAEGARMGQAQPHRTLLMLDGCFHRRDLPGPRADHRLELYRSMPGPPQQPSEMLESAARTLICLLYTSPSPRDRT